MPGAPDRGAIFRLPSVRPPTLGPVVFDVQALGDGGASIPAVAIFGLRAALEPL
jgi:hypothetical protein